jgi:hypothetical protein
MNKSELISALEDADIAPASYWLDGGLPSEAYCLEQRPDVWAVYYSQHGQRTGETHFGTEEAACSALYAMLLKDPMTRQGPWWPGATG